MTLLQSTEQVVELAEIATDARDFVAASRAENTTRVYRVYASEWGELALILWRHSGKQRCGPLAEVSTRSMVLPAGAALSRRSGRGTGSASTALLGYVLGQFGAQLLRHARSSG